MEYDVVQEQVHPEKMKDILEFRFCRDVGILVQTLFAVLFK